MSAALADLSNGTWMVPAGRTVRGTPKVIRLGAEENAYKYGFYEFARSYGGVAVNRIFVSVTVQNTAEGAVYLRNLRLVELRCAAALRGTLIKYRGGADPSPPRTILIDLDAPNPRPWYFPRGIGRSLELPPGDPPRGQQPFGFQLGQDRSETFEVVAILATRRSCGFKLVMDTVTDGVKKEYVITDSGRPFRVTGEFDDDAWNFSPPLTPTEEGGWHRFKTGEIRKSHQALTGTG
ncbi:hypothetical protein DPM19_18700 [Actinomadura craniellae]|uniref:Uncharacterized protein n=1 Tax=Actinomadura craniellae TaxID=2231787 RepID=A0A365H3K9_9ACTN|nr:hypothetical protein [Actinomadura craniellae]RAY13694.1 hypothetical protein DPM19_18700 [Actinomadura craniellae]